MSRPLYRIYLAPDHLGHLQQTPRRTRDFYEVDPSQFQEGPQTRWFRVVQASPGRVFSALWKAGGPERENHVTIAELGAFMRMFSSRWYVDARDLRLEDAIDINQSALTRPRVLALLLAALVLGYFGVMSLLSHQSGQPAPEIQPLARFVALAMLFLLATELLLNGLKKWRRQSQGFW